MIRARPRSAMRPRARTAGLLLPALACAALLAACGPAGPAAEAELEVVVAAYRHVYAEHYSEARTSVVADFASAREEQRVARRLEEPFAKAVGAAVVPEAERRLVCDEAEGGRRCTFNGHHRAVTPSGLRVDGDRASVTLTFIVPNPCAPDRFARCTGGALLEGYRLELVRRDGGWRVVGSEPWFT